MKRGQPIFVVSGLNLLNEQKSYVSEVAYQDKKIFIPISIQIFENVTHTLQCFLGMENADDDILKVASWFIGIPRWCTYFLSFFPAQNSKV